MAKQYEMRYAKGSVGKHLNSPFRVRKELLTVLLVILMVLAVACGWYFNTLTSKLDPLAKKGTLSVSGDGDKRSSANTISIVLNTAPTFEDGVSPGSIFFENPAYSGKLEQLEIYVNATGELIYKSGYLEPGTYIDYAPLSVALEAGEYECTAVIYGYNKDAQEYIGRAAAGIVVHVLN